MIKKKYEFTDETKEHCGHIIRRIKAVRDFGDVRKGDLGGWIEDESNLSHHGKCWVYDDAYVYDKAAVRHNAQIHNFAHVYGCAKVLSNAQVYDCARIKQRAFVGGYAKVNDSAVISEKATVIGESNIGGCAYIGGDIFIDGCVSIRENVILNQCITLRGNIIIASREDYIIFNNWWSSGRTFVWTRSNNMWSVGCFYGTGAELIEKAYKDSAISGREYERVVKYVESILADENNEEKI